MYYSIGIKLKALDTDRIRYFTGKKLHAVFLSLIGEVERDVSTVLHDKQKPKEFTVSPLLGGEGGEVVEGRNYFFRVTFLREELYKTFSRRIATKVLGGVPVKVEGCRFAVEEVVYQDSPLAGSFSDLETNRRRVTLEFMSPTMFKSGDHYVRYPEKRYIFKSLLTRYNSYSEEKISERILEDLHRVHYERMDIRLKRVQMKSYFMEGFVGRCILRIDSKDEGFIRDVNTLLNFSFFSGIGQKTSMGFGQIRIKQLGRSK